MGNETEKTPGPTKLRPIGGLLSLSSSNHKKSLVKFLPRINRKQILQVEFDSGFIRSRDLSKFCSNVFQYLLYDNEIIPFPFQYFQKAYESRFPVFGGSVDLDGLTISNEQSKQRDEEDDEEDYQKPIQVFSNALKPQVQKMYCQLYESFDYLNQLFEKTLSVESVKCIALAIGASIRFIKEVFILDLSGLNIASRTSSIPHKRQQIIVSLSNLVQVFFRKLMDASNSGEVKPGNVQKRKQNSVFVLAQLNGIDDNDAVERFYSSSSINLKHHRKSGEFVPEVLEKLGSNGTRTTVFKLQQDEFYTRPMEDDFEIFCDEEDPNANDDENAKAFCCKSNLDETEEIVECLTEEDENELQRGLNSSHRSESTSSLASSASASSEKSDNLESFCEERTWIELIPHVNCVAKL